MDSTPNALNPDRDSTPNGLNPDWESTPNGLNPDWDSTPNGLNPDWDSTPNGINSEWDSTSNFYQPGLTQNGTQPRISVNLKWYNFKVYIKNMDLKREYNNIF
jgi:hypothetical protein